MKKLLFITLAVMGMWFTAYAEEANVTQKVTEPLVNPKKPKPAFMVPSVPTNPPLHRECDRPDRTLGHQTGGEGHTRERHLYQLAWICGVLVGRTEVLGLANS